MPNGPPWKLAIVALVAIIAGVALLMVDWTTIAQLVAFVAMFFVARGALHIITMSFEGLAGALSALLGGGEIGVGLVLLVWPAPTLLVLAAVVGAWVSVWSVVDATIVLATRADIRRWPVRVVGAIVRIALGLTVVARPGGTIDGTAITLGALAIFGGILEILALVGQSDAVSQSRATRSS